MVKDSSIKSRNFLSYLMYLLRHYQFSSEVMDENGWISKTLLLDHIENDFLRKEKSPFDALQKVLTNKEEIPKIQVETRVSGLLRKEIYIRATHGHTNPNIKVEYELSKNPPEILYHHTTHENFLKILKEGLVPYQHGRPLYFHGSLEDSQASIEERRSNNAKFRKLTSNLVILSVNTEDLQMINCPVYEVPEDKVYVIRNNINPYFINRVN